MTQASGRKSIFITGAASGMGRETAQLFARNGWFVGAYDVNQGGLETLTMIWVRTTGCSSRST